MVAVVLVVATDTSDITGTVMSEVKVSVLLAWLPVEEALEEAMPAGTCTGIVPLEPGSTLNVNTELLLEAKPLIELDAVPPSVTSPASKPVTSSENVAVTGMDEAFVVEALVLESATVGPPVSADASRANEAAAAAPARRASDVITETIRRFVLLINL